MADGRTVELVGPAGEVWEMLKAPCSAHDLAAGIASRHDTIPSVVARQTDELIADLVTLGVVEVAEIGRGAPSPH